MNNVATGNRGEQLAASYLVKAGYRILARQYRNRLGEIDIVSQIGDIIAFVEVKTRRSEVFGMPAEAVTYKKQQKIIRTALCYLGETDKRNTAIRFDVLEIRLLTDDRVTYNHIINAFGS